MTKINKGIDFRKIFKVTSKSDWKKEMKMLHVNGGHVYATDSFKAVKLKTGYNETDKGFITKLDAMVAAEISKSEGIVKFPDLSNFNYKFPEVDTILNKENTDYEITVNRKHLIDLLDAMQKSDNLDQITFCVSKDPRQPVFLKSNNGIGILMPIIK